MPIKAAAARIDRGGVADQPAVHGDPRAAGVAGVDRGVGLEEEAVIGDAAPMAFIELVDRDPEAKGVDSGPVDSGDEGEEKED